MAAFTIDTDDEIVIDAATGGRTTFRNAGSTRRRGFELAWDGEFAHGLTAHAAFTYLRAEFADAFVTGSPPVTIPAGTRLPGVPARTAYAELAWTPPTARWLSLAIETQHVGKIAVNDRNSDAAPAYTIANLRIAAEHRRGDLRISGFVRINNLADRNYVGAVIVGDTNGRYFEPAPGVTVSPVPRSSCAFDGRSACRIAVTERGKYPVRLASKKRQKAARGGKP